MQNRTLLSKIAGFFLCTCILYLNTNPATADVRAEYLVNLLENGSSYRVKIQAAQSLGRLQCKEAIPSLIKALKDESPPVVIAAATALGEIGDPSALPALKAANQKKHTSAVKIQLSASIRLLQAAVSEEKSADPATLEPVNVRFMVKVDAMGNSSATTTPNITEIMRSTVISVLSQNANVEIQPDSMTESQIRKIQKKKEVITFILSGALIELRRENQFMIAKVALNVLSNPDYNLVMMPSGEARVPIDYSVVAAAKQQGASPETVNDLEKKAMAIAEKLVLEKLIDNLVGKILVAVPDVL